MTGHSFKSNKEAQKEKPNDSNTQGASAFFVEEVDNYEYYRTFGSEVEIEGNGGEVGKMWNELANNFEDDVRYFDEEGILFFIPGYS